MKHTLPIKKDARGELLPFYAQDFDFDWKRCFIIKNSPKGAVRGNHAHKREFQMILVLSGSISLSSDYGFKVEQNTLNENEYVVLPPLSWNTFIVSEEDTSILVLGSEMCDEEEYIRDYEEFTSRVRREVV